MSDFARLRSVALFFSFVSPFAVRVWFVVAAAMRLAVPSLRPFRFRLVLMCSYWRSRFALLTPRGGIAPPPCVPVHPGYPSIAFLAFRPSAQQGACSARAVLLRGQEVTDMGMDPKQMREVSEKGGAVEPEDQERDVSPEARPRAGKAGEGGMASGHTEGHPEGAPNPRPEGKGNRGR